MKLNFRRPLGLIYHYARKYWPQLILVVLLFGITTGLVSIKPLVMAPLINVATGQDLIGAASSDASSPLSLTDIDLNNVDDFVAYYLNLGRFDVWTIVLLLGGIYLVLTLLEALFEFLSYQLTVWIRVRMFRGLQRDFFGHLLGHSLDFFHHQKTGEIISRMENDTRNSVSGLPETIRILIVSSFMISLYGVLLMRTNLRLTLLITATALVQWGAIRLLRSSLRQRVRDQFEIFAEANAYLQEIFQNIRVVKSFAVEAIEHSRFSKLTQRMLPIHTRFAIYKHLNTPLSIVIKGLTNVTVLLLATRDLLEGNLTTAGFFLFLFLGREIIAPLTRLTDAYVNIQVMTASSERIIEMFNLLPTVIGGSVKTKNFERAIRLENVSFSYDNEPVLRNVSFEIERGQVTALVGPSGAGKSTLTDLIMRFYDPDEGLISIDGHDLRALQIESYRHLFGVVAQENLLFNTSIAENIAYAREGIDDRSIEEAARIANANEFIEKFPEAYRTVVGDRGVRVSGGQRQRIAIARAIVHRPQILILDEATSSLDTESERLVQAAIDRVIQNTTAVVIAHRLSTVIHADKIIVLDEGSILDQGKHAELLERCSLYQHLCELQFQMNGDIASRSADRQEVEVPTEENE